MSAIYPLLLGLGILPAADGEHPGAPPVGDTAHLREMLQDRQHPCHQCQAALLLVQSPSSDAAEIVRQGLQQTENQETFTALAAALRLCRDPRFTEELLGAFGSGRPAVREAAAETLAVLADPGVIRRLQRLAGNPATDLGVRQAALGTLGRTGRQAAAAVLLNQLTNENEVIRLSAAGALEELAGQGYGNDLTRWSAWWESHHALTEAGWLEERLAYQTSRARRLEGELDRAKSQVVRLHQQLYSRLPLAERLRHVQALADYEDPMVRALAVAWGVELLPSSDAVGLRILADLLLKLSDDAAPEVQRAAALALGRVVDARVPGQLQVLLRKGRAPVRAAAARALAQQAAGPALAPDVESARALRRRVVPALQKALDDPALEVVVEAAEDLGALGVPEAGPVLAALLHHPSEPVRQAAAQALERVADLAVLDDLLAALDDRAVPVRFTLIGAVGHAAGDGRSLIEPQRGRLLNRLQDLLVRDPDPGVRSRAATVLGECGPAGVLPTLWQRVVAAEDGRVQDKAWSAVVSILTRAGSLDLLAEWDRTLTEANQGPRRLQLLAAVVEGWRKREDASELVVPATETLIQAELEQGKWSAAVVHLRELPARPGTDAERERRLRWLLTAGEQAVEEGNAAESLRLVREAQPLLPPKSKLAAEFEKLQNDAKKQH
jgi:HEAT repeat protein